MHVVTCLRYGVIFVKLSCLLGVPASFPEMPPNVIFILADDLGYADLSCYGRKGYETPNLDKLAANGIRLTHGYANSPVCSATRVSVLTGQYQYRFPTGLHEPLDNGHFSTEERAARFVPLPLDVPTFPKLLKERGYSTHLVGKWHLGKLPHNGPRQYGYDKFFGFLGGATDYFQHRMFLDKKVSGDGLVVDDEFVEKQGYLTDLLGDDASRIVKEHQNKTAPFLISLHFNAPHWPWEGPEDEKVAAELRQLSGSEGNIEVYGRMVRSMDANIGKVVSALRETGQLDNTLIVFTSDNGGERFSDTWPFVGVKTELFEGGLRVPLIISWPQGLPQGVDSEQVATSMDLFPTILGAVDSSDEPNPSPSLPFDGENLIGVLAGRQQEHPRKLFWRFKASAQAAVLDGDWKYLKIAGSEYLFNVRRDCRERNDYRDKKLEIFEQLKTDYEQWNKTMLPYPAEVKSGNPLWFAIHDRYQPT